MANITPALREEMAGVPTTSTSVERIFALFKRRADRGGVERHDNRAGAVACKRDRTDEWLRGKSEQQQDGMLTLARKRRRAAFRTMAAERALKGEANAKGRSEALSKKRSGRAKRAAELERIKGLELANKYSALKVMGNDTLKDQLKIFKVCCRPVYYECMCKVLTYVYTVCVPLSTVRVHCIVLTVHFTADH